MILEVIKYGHPTLRQKGAAIDAITPEIEKLIADMLDTMVDYQGVGLAAQQVNQAIQLAVIDVREMEDRPSWIEVDGKRDDVAKYMPMVLINPILTQNSATVAGPEGCLSFPEIYADITRPDEVDVKALNAKGEPIQFRCGGLLARAVQHETDHLHGILFIDRMDRETKNSLRDELEILQSETKLALGKRRPK